MNSDKYIDIKIDYNNNTFSITESDLKPKKYNSAVESLSKIEYIIENKLLYVSTNSDDIYSKYSESELFATLQEKSSKISNGYHEKSAKLNSLARKIFSKEKQILKIYTRIQNLGTPPEVFPIPDDMAVQEISKYLDAASLKALSQVNRQAKVLTTAPIVKRAKEFGYEGKDPAEAFKYINDLFKEVNQLVDEKIIPEKYLSYNKIPKKYFFSKKEKLDVEKTLRNLQKCSKEDLFTILSNQTIYLPDFNNFIKIFNSKDKWKINGEENTSIKENGAKALILAAKTGNLTILEFLLEQGADPNTPIQNASPPLHHAAQRGNAEMVALLLKHKAKINEKAQGYNTPLAFACGYGNIDLYKPNVKVINLLIKNGADLNIRDKQGLSLLDRAAKTGQLDILKVLLDYGADPHAPNDHGYVPLCYAVQENQLDILKTLIEYDVKVGKKAVPYTTLLAFASGYGRKNYKSNPEIFELLLQNGANPNIADNRGYFPLHDAAHLGNADIVKVLLDYGATVDVKLANKRTPLSLACAQQSHIGYFHYNPKVIELLLERGADPYAKDVYGFSPYFTSLFLQFKTEKLFRDIFKI